MHGLTETCLLPSANNSFVLEGAEASIILIYLELPLRRKQTKEGEAVLSCTCYWRISHPGC